MLVAAPGPPLVRSQLGWVAALIVFAQLPLWPRLPLWVVAVGSGLVAARLLLPADHPVPTRVRRWLLPTLALLVAIGVRMSYGYFLARDPCVAFLYTLVGVKYLESRDARDGALLACLALFLLLTQYFYGQSIGSAALSLPAVFVLGGTMAALREAPKPRTRWYAPLFATGRMLMQGVPLAALLFVLFPRLAGPLWGTPAETGARTGLSDRMAPGSISELSLSDAVAFRVDFVGRPPPSPQRYWRGPVLSRFDGFEWTASQSVKTTRIAFERGPSIDYTVTMEPNNRTWLFALEHPTGLPQPAVDDLTAATGLTRSLAILTEDDQLLASAPVTQAIRYRQRSAVSDRIAMRSLFDASENIRLPHGNPRSVAFALDMREKAGSDRAFIVAILKWFRSEPFVYTLAPPLLEGDRVDGFLFDTRRGFCEHYAGAFVFLLRAAGIPARVVTGYQGGEINPDGGYMIVRDSDAHAWAEALLDGVWQRFDPTAAVAPSRIERGLGAALPQGEPVPYLARVDMTWLKSLRLHLDAVNYQWQRSVVGFNLRRQRDVLRDLGLAGARPWQLVALVGAFVLAWGITVIGLAGVRRARADPASLLWRALCRRLARAGLPRTPSEGPIAYTQRAAKRWPQWSTALERVGELYAALRYGPGEKNEDRIAALRSGIAALPSARRLLAVPDAGDLQQRVAR
jgi:transglutaminase-like putative cysteine protease